MKKYITITLAALAVSIVSAAAETPEPSRAAQAAAVNAKRSSDYRTSAERKDYVLQHLDLIQSIMQDSPENLSGAERSLVGYYGAALILGLDIDDQQAVSEALAALAYSPQSTARVYEHALTWDLTDVQAAISEGRDFASVDYLTDRTKQPPGFPNYGKFKNEFTPNEIYPNYLGTGLLTRHWQDWFRGYVSSLPDNQAISVLDEEIRVLTSRAPNSSRDKWLSELIGIQDIRKRLAQ